MIRLGIYTILMAGLIFILLFIIGGCTHANAESMRLTGYCQDEDGGGCNALGYRLCEGQCAAASSIPFGTQYELPNGEIVTVTDRGSKVCEHNHLDIFGNHRIRDMGRAEVKLVRWGWGGSTIYNSKRVYCNVTLPSRHSVAVYSSKRGTFYI
jgi:3D (Asp-Asp-Asp) domain-containing protein